MKTNKCQYSCSLVCVFAVLINKVFLQVTVEGFNGSSVVLPCSSTQHDHELQDIDVYWVYSGSTNVFDIIKGEESEAGQDPRYKKRVKPLHPEAYLRGNFSITLTALTHADAGKYTCLITHSSEHETVELLIKESTTEKANKTTKLENLNPAKTTRNQRMRTAALLGLLCYMRETPSKFMTICEPSDHEEDVIKGVVIGILVVVEHLMEPLPAFYNGVALVLF
ncbi:hypothetical protein QQF64_018927 [Cirrhinus molitorella]|uniref:Ig-like domain-containing protein n=1 Tax=Cirrhinus molitorella TaxID=172907 RepID=A0ABR3LGE4_9TELE